MAKKLKGRFDSYIAEYLAIHEGLAFAKDNLLSVDRVESNSLRVVTVLGRHEEETLILDDVRYLLSEASNGSCCFIPRDGEQSTGEFDPANTISTSICYIHAEQLKFIPSDM
ncbi:hypothetical protein PanWU01x14_249570 [Parasponia andersonii]|uniref:RNase H type-1 domain-containing protein n=1 Tax=Parasponia andersonii TaxID=3476 RepID=A0A2P5BD12_PARAD|nr:hypothetical protein PanWU01x14_249570 [Parasponia andersonii]